MTEEQKYALKYLVAWCNPPQTISEIHLQTGNGDYGAADALVVHSLLFQPDGSCNEAIFSLDGRSNKPVSDAELFKCMVSLAYQLRDSKELGDGRKQFCHRIFRIVQKAITEARSIETPPPETGFLVRGKDVTQLSETELTRYLATQDSSSMQRWVVALVKWIKEHA